MFSCGFCDISNKTCFHRTPTVPASEQSANSIYTILNERSHHIETGHLFCRVNYVTNLYMEGTFVVSRFKVNVIDSQFVSLTSLY